MFVQSCAVDMESMAVASVTVSTAGKVLNAMFTTPSALWRIVPDTAIAGKECASASKDGQEKIVRQVRIRMELFFNLNLHIAFKKEISRK